jgi:hypothetical protein
MSAHVAAQVGGAEGVDKEKFVPRTNNDKAEYEAWLKRQQTKKREQGGTRGAMLYKAHALVVSSNVFSFRRVNFMVWQAPRRIERC